jgi:membrane associated rhomboid family serine protease
MTFPTEGGPPEPAPEVAPVCPRHPDRVSYVRCQRCERPVCPQCQREAAVGIQCVDCVKEAAKTARPARTVLGGAHPGDRPLVTQGIIGICVLLYLLQILPGSTFTEHTEFVPALAKQEPWRFLTSAFVHSPSLLPVHIGFNMYALWLIGPYLEQLLGRLRFAVLYLVSAFGGSVVFLLLATPSVTSRSWFTGAVGASGAVFGLFAAVVAINRKLGRNSQAMVGIMALNFVFGFVYPNVAWQAHLGGALTGAAIAAVFAFAPTGRGRTQVQLLGVVAVLVLLAVATLVKFSTVPAGLL